MKKLLIASIIIYFLGLILKTFHFPASFLVILGTGLFTVYSLVFFVKRRNEKVSLSFALISSSLFLIYILTRMFYWTSIPIIGVSLYLIMGVVFGLLSLAKAKSEGATKLLGTMTMTTLFLCCIILANISTDRIYYFFNMRDLVNHSSGYLEYDMEKWNHYSWFLYEKGDCEGAFEANEIAIKAALELNKQTEGKVIDFIEKLKERKSKIQSKSWDSYQ